MSALGELFAYCDRRRSGWMACEIVWEDGRVWLCVESRAEVLTWVEGRTPEEAARAALARLREREEANDERDECP